MKTLQELYKEIIASNELKKAFLEAAKDDKMTDFLKAQGCDATEADLETMMNGQSDQELSDEELDNVAGGTCNKVTYMEVKHSCKTLGVSCAVMAIISAAGGHVGQEDKSEGRLCTIK